MVGQSELNHHNDEASEHGHQLSIHIYAFDKLRCREQTYQRFVRAKRAPEKLR
jgi:hypothetical protein